MYCDLLLCIMTFVVIVTSCYMYCDLFMYCDLLGADVVLGKVLVEPDNRIPDHQLVGRLKHTPGSGILSLKCSSDGPTRVLTITDENKKVRCLVTMIFLIVGLCF